MAESDAEDVKPDCPSYHQTAHFELKHKVPSFIHNLLYNSYTSINAFTAFLCSKKQSHCNLLSHIQTIHFYIHRYITHAKHELRHNDVIQNFSPLITFPKASVSIAFCPTFLCKYFHKLHLWCSCKTYLKNPQCTFSESGTAEDSSHIHHCYICFRGKVRERFSQLKQALSNGPEVDMGKQAPTINKQCIARSDLSCTDRAARITKIYAHITHIDKTHVSTPPL